MTKICGKVTTKRLSWLAIVLFIITLLPICYLAFVNRATGDDYGYGTYTRYAWTESHSLIALGRAVGQTVRQYYYGWQGTWFSVAVFSLQPEIFNDKAYVIVVFLMLFLWIGSTVLLFHQILCRELGLSKWCFLLAGVVILTAGIQFIPSTKSSIFWFNGGAHYMLPFAMCQVLIWCLIRYGKAYQMRYLAGITVIAGLLGGSNYQAALFALIVMGYAIVSQLFFGNYAEEKRKLIYRKTGLLGIPVLLELIGLFISMKAPGNKIRGGEEFGFSVGNVVSTIGRSFLTGSREIGDYLREKPLVFVGLFFLFVVLLEAFAEKKNFSGVKEEPEKAGSMKHPLVMFLALFCLYCAMQAPALYADVGVSGGVGNMNYQVFLLMAAGWLMILADWFAGRISRWLLKSGNCKEHKKDQTAAELVHTGIVIPALLLSLALAAVFRSSLKESTFFVSLEYIRSGQAADYKEQMDIQTALLTDESVRDVVVPFINDVQGPLMQMPVTEDPDSWTNTVTKNFYGKDSVVAIPRDVWMESCGQ